MTYIRTARHRDIALVGERMRMRDVEEVKASHGLGPCEALELAINISTKCWTACDQYGDPFLMFGVSPYMDGIGCPWALATDAFRQNVRFVLENTPRKVRDMHIGYPTLMNYVDVRNTDSIRYIRWAGYTFTAYDPSYGVGRRPFLQFTRTTPCVHQ